jgi:HK97 family phage major capsid protein
MNRRQKSLSARQRRIHIAAFVLLSIITMLLLPAALSALGLAPEAALATVGLFGCGRILWDKAGGEGGGTLTTSEFQSKVLAGVTSLETEVKTVKSGQEKILEDQKRWSGELKTAMEDVTRLKNTANEQDANMKGFIKRLGDLDQILRREATAAFGDPVRRVQNNEELRERFNIACRLAVDKDGHFMKMLEPRIKALGEDASPGSTMINSALAAEMFDLLTSYGAWNTVDVVPLGTKTTIFPVDTADPVCNVILTEGGTISDDTNITGTTVNGEAEVLATLLNASLQLIEDAEYDLTGYLMRKFARAHAKRQDHLVFTADGTADATNGGMTGIFNGGTLVAAAAGEDTVEELDLEDFMACLTAVDVEALSRPTFWWMHPFQLIRTLGIKDSNGRPIFLTALEAPAPGAIGSILGSPVIRTNIAPSTNTANTRVATFGVKEGMVAGVRSSYKFEASDHHRWSNLQRCFRSYSRFGTKLRSATAFANLRLTT